MSFILNIKTLRLTVVAAAIVLPTVSHAAEVSCSAASNSLTTSCMTAKLYIPQGKRVYLSASATTTEGYVFGPAYGRVTLYRNGAQLYEARFSGSHNYNHVYNNSGTYRAIVNGYRVAYTMVEAKVRY